MSYDSWGRIDVKARRAQPAMDLQANPFSGDDGWLPFGNGRSYGDSCHNDSGTLVDCRSSAQIVDFDPQSGALRCEAGLLLADLLAFALPRGFFCR